MGLAYPDGCQYHRYLDDDYYNIPLQRGARPRRANIYRNPSELLDRSAATR